MPIPESQLVTWSNQGAITTSQETHEAVRTALTSLNSTVRGKNFEIYLQGSYKNSTNIRGDSDVDVVVQFNNTFGRDISELPPNQQQLYKQSHGDAIYLWEHFRADVLYSLRQHFGSTHVIEGNKSIKISPPATRLPADVVPCIQYRRYKKFISLDDQNYVEGMKFYTLRENRMVINYPKIHYDNGTVKNSATSGRFKPTVRVFKNARTYMIDNGLIQKDLAPSYFLENLIYNIPDNKFDSSFGQTFCNILNWLDNEANLESFLCQNRQILLFGTSQEQWNVENARLLNRAFINFWNGWR